MCSSEAPSGAEPRSRPVASLGWWFRNRETGAVTVAQFPNWSITIFGVATVARRLIDPTGGARVALTVIGTTALVLWAVDELARGVNPWRRLLGAVVLGTTVVGFVR